MPLKLKRLEHVGIAVSDLDKSDNIFSTLFNRQPYKRETVESEFVQTSFFQTGGSKVELLEAIDGQGAIGSYIDKKGGGIHHLAFEVEDIYEAHQYCIDNGFRVLNEAPKKGADNKLIFFIHPKSTGGILLEFCQEINPEPTSTADDQ